MKVIILGNAGAGKSTLALKLMGEGAASCLSLDEVAFSSGVNRRPLADSIAEVKQFVRSHASWIIEGCYADIIEAVLSECDELIFLNPGVDVCIAHCRARPWEPEKFGSREAQDAHLASLIAWVSAYESRDDEYGLRRHRALFDGFRGPKREIGSALDARSS